MSAGVVQLDSFSRLLKLLETWGGRDRITRFIQYVSRFLAFYLKESNADYAKRFETMQGHSALARKVFRLGKSLSHLKMAYTALNEEDPIVQVSTIIQNLGLAVWLYYDNWIWFIKSGLLKNTDAAPLLRRSNQAWLLAMIISILKNAYLLRKTEASAQRTSMADVKNKIRTQQKTYAIDLIRTLLDVPIPLTQLSTRAAGLMNSGFVGACGTISSMILLHQEWQKNK